MPLLIERARSGIETNMEGRRPCEFQAKLDGPIGEWNFPARRGGMVVGFYLPGNQHAIHCFP